MPEVHSGKSGFMQLNRPSDIRWCQDLYVIGVNK